MKKILVFLFLVSSFELGAQLPVGFANASCHAESHPYVIGDIFLGHQNGGLSVLVNSSLVVRVEEISESKNYKIFPNPASNVVNIKCEDGSLIEKVKLFDLKGNEISVAYNHGSLDLNSMEKGIYILWIERQVPLKLIIE
jgi:hypothetical protein